jgi:hypothetical protein
MGERVQAVARSHGRSFTPAIVIVTPQVLRYMKNKYLKY